MANIEVSLSNTNALRRRKGTSLGGGSVVSQTRSPARMSMDDMTNGSVKDFAQKDQQTPTKDRESNMHDSRMQIDKTPIYGGAPLETSDRSVTEHRLDKLRTDTTNKRVTIRNLKTALEKLDVTDDIDNRIRQAELEYILGREELQLLSMMEETRALQSRLEKSLKTDTNNSNHPSLYNQLQSGINLSLHSIQATIGHFAVTNKFGLPGLFFVEWTADSEHLLRGDRVLEVNGAMLTAKTQQEFQETIGSSGKCRLVIVRKQAQLSPSQQQLIQSQEDNTRLQHRISYLEEQVNEMKDLAKEKTIVANGMTTAQTPHNEKKRVGGHVTSISIKTSTPADAEKTHMLGSYVTRIVGGTTIEQAPQSTPLNKHQNITKTMIKEIAQNKRTKSELEEHRYSYNQQRNHYNTMLQHSHSHQHLAAPMSQGPIKSMSSSRISIKSDRNEWENAVIRDTRRMSNGDDCVDDSSSHSRKSSSGDASNGHSRSRLSEVPNGHYRNVNRNGAYPTYQVEKLIGFPECTPRRLDRTLDHKTPFIDSRSVSSLDFDKDTTLNGSIQIPTKQQPRRKHRETDYTSDSMADAFTNGRLRNGIRPTPPKKPLRLSLQRAQSLQTIEANAAATIMELDKKRAFKRSYRSGNKTPEMQHYIENSFNGSQPQLQTASLGRQKHL